MIEKAEKKEAARQFKERKPSPGFLRCATAPVGGHGSILRRIWMLHRTASFSSYVNVSTVTRNCNRSGAQRVRKRSSLWFSRGWRKIHLG